MKSLATFPPTSDNFLARTLHAIAFTFVDRTDSGHDTIALSNFAARRQAVLSGWPFCRKGTTTSHAEQRALRGLEGAASRNLVAEFRPEWEPLLLKLHIQRILPAWWTSWQPHHP